MKFVKGFSLFFLYPIVMFALGVYASNSFKSFFYPGDNVRGIPSQKVIVEESKEIPIQKEIIPIVDKKEDAVETILKEETLNADTEYVLEEVDIKKETSVETVWKVPEKYLGMNREAFVEAMEEYAFSPPLAEQERGFIGLEVLSFSAKKVVIRMNYAYVEPTESFYLSVQNNYIVVYLDDKETVYMHTDILLEHLPDNVQQEVIGFMHFEDEEALYNFLESYSS